MASSVHEGAERANRITFVGGRIEAEGTGAKFSICQDGRTWKAASGNMDPLFSVVGPAYYAYQVRCELSPGAKLMKLYQDMVEQYMQLVNVEEMDEEMGFDDISLFSTRY